jgi:hypothetical protein
MPGPQFDIPADHHVVTKAQSRVIEMIAPKKKAEAVAPAERVTWTDDARCM